ncbi:Uncharacterised protein [Pseudomonas fluorescens]|uniref:Uncharacterized protein n=1 Tax=Pseudomonas fluorescens TaxID=294 RepID=A0A8B4I5L5_PSEFL|nr:Uncharacterised protein [Pseudomonas fluorescens]
MGNTFRFVVKNAGDLAASRCFYNGDVVYLDVTLLVFVGRAVRSYARGEHVLGEVARDSSAFPESMSSMAD